MTGPRALWPRGARDRVARIDQKAQPVEQLIEWGLPPCDAPSAAASTTPTTWLTVRIGPGPSLETFAGDAEVDALLDVIYDGERPARSVEIPAV